MDVEANEEDLVYVYLKQMRSVAEFATLVSRREVPQLHPLHLLPAGLGVIFSQKYVTFKSI